MRLNINSISGKTFRFQWKGPVHSTAVEITIPLLEELEYSAWGDWGPMYEFKLNNKKPIFIKYNDEVVKSSQRLLKISSPMLAEEREETPYYLVIEDRHKNLSFYLYLGENFELAKTEVIRRQDKVKLFASSDHRHLQNVV